MYPRIVALVAALTLAAGTALADEKKNPLTESETWNYLRDVIIGDVVPQEGAEVLALEAPYRAHDAATVPIVLRQVGGDPVKRLTLVVDENPAPVAATIEFGEAMQPLKLETRVRVDQYSNVRAIAEVADGHFMSGAFVKASGGCSAPATSDPVAARNEMGDMRLRHFDDPAPGRREAQVMIRHPNYSGLQRDQITQLFIPPHFINYLEVRQGDELLFKLEGGISISEDPVFRFEYTDNGAAEITVEARDTEGNVFRKVMPKPASS
jgi:sulfur-oxidizing protein SoxY